MFCLWKNYLKKFLATRGCSVSKKAMIGGWFGVIWRSTISVLVSYYFKVEGSDSSTILRTALIGILSYLLLSFLTNILFLAAISQNWPYALLPYISIQGIELIIYLFFMTSLSMILYVIKVNAAIWLVVPIMVVILALNAYFFAYSLVELRKMEFDIRTKKREKEIAANQLNRNKEPPRKSLRAIRQEKLRATAQL
ncbi:uncharacterized protein [Leptinotarsa decemlineata]|uniref:uncharacterized protein n=1 Tax=Leptinotarsa decemlineata TaxID=7539 RepID=UPI000C254C44|nr:uncharacterized protein LOC111508782 [Leptinotarsa decemlineata]XP_023020161.1 uncharacterized protein LOC111508782 [Leptinotarsa decemlineata]XP_023020163.1 uncharacterized protein LOC111508782 [Leptinotarsa decemlineata]XP_023020164.1 uncharacterized protein LOC111508782 [Leptinotarsa decemlineata]